MQTGNIALMKSKILVVDDELSIRRICTLYLQAEGMAVTALPGAEELVDIARAENPDVIVLDLNMPVIDGFAAANELKKKTETAQIPILILSGRLDVEDKRRAMLQSGADDYLTKPFDPEELITRIAVLRRRKNEREVHRKEIETLEKQVEELSSKLTESLANIHKFDDMVFDLFEHEFIDQLNRIRKSANRLSKNGNGNKPPAIAKLLEGTRRLQGLAEKVLELKYYHSKRIRPEIRDISLSSLIDPLRDAFEKKASSNGVEFVSHCSDPDLMIKTDAKRLRQAVELLLDRALEGTSQGRVEFSASVDADTLELAVTDNIRDGSPKKGYARTAISVGRRGNGHRNGERYITLPLARHIVKLLGGLIMVRPTQDQGSRFSVVLPLTEH